MASRASDLDQKELVQSQAAMNARMNSPEEYAKRKQAQMENIAFPMMEKKAELAQATQRVANEPETSKVDYAKSQEHFNRQFWLEEVKNQPQRDAGVLQKRVVEEMYPGLRPPKIGRGISGGATASGPGGELLGQGPATAASTVEKMGRLPGPGMLDDIIGEDLIKKEKERKGQLALPYQPYQP